MLQKCPSQACVEIRISYVRSGMVCECETMMMMMLELHLIRYKGQSVSPLCVLTILDGGEFNDGSGEVVGVVVVLTGDGG